MTINRQPPLLLPMMDLWKWIPVMSHVPAAVAAILCCGYDEGVGVDDCDCIGVGAGATSVSTAARLVFSATPAVYISF